MNDKEKVLYQKRIKLLIKRLDDNKDSKSIRTTIEAVYAGSITLFDSIYGKNSNQSKVLFECKKASQKSSNNSLLELDWSDSLSGSLKGFLQNLEEEINGDLIINIKTEAKGEVLGDLLVSAKKCLSEGNVQTASVLACACLEDAVKRKSEEYGINIDNKSLSSIINALKSKSFFSGSQGPIVSSFVKLRNAAMHAEWNKINETDISSLIGFMEPFLHNNFANKKI